MKWLIACLAVLFMVAPAMAGEDIYIAIVGPDENANTFYLSPKYTQFLKPQAGNPSLTGSETFNHPGQDPYPEICDMSGTGTINGVAIGPGAICESGVGYTYTTRGNPNYRVTADNSGWYEWKIILPKKPSGEINLAIQCGIIKPDEFADKCFDAVAICAAETGEWVGPGCTRLSTDPGEDPIKAGGLPFISARAIPGVNAFWAWPAFHLTAYRNPGPYLLDTDGVAPGFAMLDTAQSAIAAAPTVYQGVTFPHGYAGSLQLLDGADGNYVWPVPPGAPNVDPNVRVLLKSCMDKTVVVKIPVEGQVNAAGETEHDLDIGDIIDVLVRIPRGNTVDIYCNAESLKVMGIGEN